MQTPENSFLSPAELRKLPFKSIGHHVLISRKASFYNMKDISIGNHVRIDDFSILSGKISLGSYIHISAQCALYGTCGILMDNFSGLSPGSKVFSVTDDFSGNYMIGPMIPEKYTNVSGGKVIICKYVQIGSGSIILPNLTVGEGIAIGALSLVNKSLDPWGIYAGIPVKRIKNREKSLIKLASKFKTL